MVDFIITNFKMGKAGTDKKNNHHLLIENDRSRQQIRAISFGGLAWKYIQGIVHNATLNGEEHCAYRRVAEVPIRQENNRE